MKLLRLEASLAITEFCLASGATPDDNLMNFLLKHSDSYSYDLIRFLCTLYIKLESYLAFRIYAENWLSIEKSVCLFTLKELWTDPKILLEVQSKQLLESRHSGLTWIHLPWTNVRCIVRHVNKYLHSVGRYFIREGIKLCFTI